MTSEGSELNADGRGCTNRRSRDPDAVWTLEALRGPNGREHALGKDRCEYEKARVEVPVKSGGVRDDTPDSGASVLSPRRLALSVSGAWATIVGLGFTGGGGDEAICLMSVGVVTVVVGSALRMRNLDADGTRRPSVSAPVES